MENQLQGLEAKGPSLSGKGEISWLPPAPGAVPARPREEAGHLLDPGPEPWCQVREFLRLHVSEGSGYLTFQSWQNPSVRGEEREPLMWESVQQKAFEELKQALTNAPGLGLPDMTKPFSLYVHECIGLPGPDLTQILGSWHRTVVYLSKKLDSGPRLPRPS